MSSFTFITPISSSMVAPSLGSIATELNITSSTESYMVLSIFVLAYAIGPLLIAPLSEMLGRVLVLQLANTVFLVFNLVCAFAQTSGQLVAFRFLAGLGGSAPLAIGGGLLSDVWLPEERGKSISLYSLGPLLGPVLGPVAGGFISQNTTWRWGFRATSIADAVILVLGLIFLQETYPPKILAKKAKRLREEFPNERFHTEYDNPELTEASILKKAFARPFLLFFTQPIIQVLAAFMAFVYGVMYLVIATFPQLWEERYHESTEIGGLNYFSLGIGFVAAAQIGGRSNDLIYKRLKARFRLEQGRPEFRVPIMSVGSILIPSGLFWYAWSAQYRLYWIMPNIGTAILAMGTTISFQSIQGYLVDSYNLYAASAISAVTVLRSICGFAFPLFAPYLYDKLDYGWGTTLLGFIAVGFGIPIPLLLWKYGAVLREKGRSSLKKL
jgi:multidrug resistance protein